MEDWLKDLFMEALECVTISDDESDINQTSAPGVVNTKTETRESNEEAENLNFLFMKERDFNCQGHEISIAECEVTLSQTQADNFTSTASVFSSQKNSFQNPRKSQLRSSFCKNSLICQECGTQFNSLSRKEKHISVSKKCRNSIKYKQTIVCLCCKIEFSCEENKLIHLRMSVSCQKFLKDHFYDSNFIEICDNYSLTKYMCPFCLFTADNGDVFDHVLNALKCRKELEDAIFKYNNEINLFSDFGGEPEQQQFTCNKCSHSFSSSGRLAAHKLKTHREVKKTKKQKNRQDGQNDLYCFNCKKFLKTQTEVEDHFCKSSRLLSRSCYRRAVWREGELQCLLCRDKFFYFKTKLLVHMHTHEKKKSPLFQFVPSVSKQDKLPPLHSSCVSAESATAASELHHSDPGPRTYLSTARDLGQQKQSRSQASENGLIKNTDYFCENCSKVFYLPDMFITHVLMHFPCLEHYENTRNNGPKNLHYCFKCKKKLEKACMEHNCIGLVVQLFQCALCPWVSPNLTNLRNHENSHHTRFFHSDTLEYKKVPSTTGGCVDDTPDYQCSPCRTLFRNLSEFLKHISQLH